MSQTRSKLRRALARRIVPAVASVGIAAGGIGAFASTASAATAHETCGGVGYNECFSITPLGNSVYSVHIGIDVYMSPQDAQAFIDHPGEEFYAKVMGDDSVWDNFLFYVPVSWSAAGPDALSAEFDVVVAGSLLNEDVPGADELYARVGLTDPGPGSRAS